jgi:AraC-like DNA-binding protein
VLALVLAAVLAAAPVGFAAPPGNKTQAGPAPTGPAVLLDRIAAVVGDEIILESEVAKLVALQVVAPRAGESAQAYRDRVLDQRITDLLRERELRKTGGLEPDRAEVEARLALLSERLALARGKTLEQVLAEAGMSREEATAFVRQGLALDTFTRERLAPSLRITDAEMRAYYEGPFRDEALAAGLPVVPPYGEVADKIRELLRERKLNEAIALWTEGLRQSTRILIYRR